MAMQKPYTLPQGIECPEAYWTIGDVRIYVRGDPCAIVTLDIYASQKLYEAENDSITSVVYTVPFEKGNVGSLTWGDVYKMLRSLPEFEKAEDC